MRVSKSTLLKAHRTYRQLKSDGYWNTGVLASNYIAEHLVILQRLKAIEIKQGRVYYNAKVKS